MTGRTHQIRVHLSYIDHPIICDEIYGNRHSAKLAKKIGLNRQFLHAWKLEFVSPGSGRLVRCEAPLPDELETVLDGLRASDEGRG